jgi:probable HAF family extracellular repeat protein
MQMKITPLILAVGIALLIVAQAQAAFFRGLGDIPAGFQEATAFGISADGIVVVGGGEGPHADEAFRWTLKDGIKGLGFLPGGDASKALAVSADGSVVVGYSHSDAGREAFRWTSAEGLVGIGDLPGGAFTSMAHSVSADGSVVVGVGAKASGETACIWIDGGLFDLQTFLADHYGLDLTGWRLTAAKLVSADGSTIVGYGFNPDGEVEAWVAHIGTKTASASAPLAPPKNLRIVFE